MRAAGRFQGLCIASFLLASIIALPARGDIILGNLAASTNDNGLIAGFETSSAFSIGFKVGATPFTLTSLDLRLRANNTPGTATVELRNDAGGNPASNGFLSLGNALVTNAQFATYNFAAPANTQLAANTTYWLTIGTTISAPDGLLIGANNPSLTPSGSLASFVGLRSGLVGSQTLDLTGIVDNPTFQINGSISAVPEPSSCGLIGLSSLILAWRYRRNVKKA